MYIATISERGQITIPAEVRRELGVHAGSRISFEVHDREAVIKPMKSLMDLAGAGAEYAKGEYVPFEVARDIALMREAEEIVREGRE
jgi:AbrB family looped-hinge helix DNA binding protein